MSVVGNASTAAFQHGLRFTDDEFRSLCAVCYLSTECNIMKYLLLIDQSVGMFLNIELMMMKKEIKNDPCC